MKTEIKELIDKINKDITDLIYNENENDLIYNENILTDLSEISGYPYIAQNWIDILYNMEKELDSLGMALTENEDTYLKQKFKERISQLSSILSAIQGIYKP